MSTYRWERREQKQKAKRERMEQHGAAYKKLILPRIAKRAQAARERLERERTEPNRRD